MDFIKDFKELVETSIESFEQFEASMISAVTGRIADSIPLPDYLQSAALLTIESGTSNRSTHLDIPMAAINDLKVVEHALYMLLTKAPESKFDPNPKSEGDLRWLMLRSPNEFTRPIIDYSRKYKARIAIFKTDESCWISIDGGSTQVSEHVLRDCEWDSFDIRKAVGATRSTSSLRNASGGGGGGGRNNHTNDLSQKKDPRTVLSMVHRGVLDFVEDIWETLSLHIETSEIELSEAEEKLEEYDTMLRELKEQSFCIDLVPLARNVRKACEVKRKKASCPYRIGGFGVGGCAAQLLGLRLVDRFHRCNGIPVASVVTFGSPRCLGGDSARQVQRGLQGVLLHVLQGDDMRAHWPPDESIPPDPNDTFGFLFPDPLRHAGPSLLLPSSTQRRKLGNLAASLPENALAWLLKSNTTASFPGGNKAIQDAWNGIGGSNIKNILSDDNQDPASYVLALVALAHCHAASASIDVNGGDTTMNGPIETARLELRLCPPEEIKYFEQGKGNENLQFWECASSYMQLLVSGGGERLKRGIRTTQQKIAQLKAQEELEEAIANAESGAAYRSELRNKVSKNEVRDMQDLITKYSQRMAKAARAEAMRPSKHRSDRAAQLAKERHAKKNRDMRNKRASSSSSSSSSSATSSTARNNLYPQEEGNEFEQDEDEDDEEVYVEDDYSRSSFIDQRAGVGGSRGDRMESFSTMEGGSEYEVEPPAVISYKKEKQQVRQSKFVAYEETEAEYGNDGNMMKDSVFKPRHSEEEEEEEEEANQLREDDVFDGHL